MATFREHRGSLRESMSTCRNVKSLNDIAKIVPIQGKLTCSFTVYDARTKWNTWIVKDDVCILGMADQELFYEQSKNG